MQKKGIYIISLTGAGICLALLLMAASPQPSAEAPQDPQISNSAALGGETEAEDRPILIDLPDIFEDLQRAPVMFYHGKHTSALEGEGCETCHPKNEDSFEFTYPPERDERDEDSLMNAYHEHCIGCHTERSAEGKKAGPLTCGECHSIAAAFDRQEYVPILPEYYDAMRDTYHKDCLSCHHEPAKGAEEAGALDWKNFYVRERKIKEAQWPAVTFDYYLHDKHDKTLEEKCELCHSLSDETQRKKDAEGIEPGCRDWTGVTQEGKSFQIKEYAHDVCINCHLERREEVDRKAGPVDCNKCHDQARRGIADMTDTARIECDVDDRILVQAAEDARMKGAAFDHAAHVKNTLSCQDCHHETVLPCAECHTPTGDEKGDYISLAEAYHEPSSAWSCIGCHENEKQKPDCAGCHHRMQTGLVESACETCHSGTLDSLDNSTSIEDPAALIAQDVKDEMEVNILENEYRPAKLTHAAIAKKLTEISDNSSLARYFHKDPGTICSGCHHYGPVEAGVKVPQCVSCHTSRNEPERDIPTLLGAYHQQCLGCHKHMGADEDTMPQSCTGCHEEKNGTPAGD